MLAAERLEPQNPAAGAAAGGPVRDGSGGVGAAPASLAAAAQCPLASGAAIQPLEELSYGR